ncbi:hypothetical protein V2J09_006775 [Rumex salicifolius]
MEDHPLQKVTIPGAILASLLHRCSSAPGDTDGLLFGHVSLITPSSLSDDFPADQSSSTDSSPTLVAAVTDFFSSGTTTSFYDSAGHIDVASLRRFLPLSPSLHLLGWFSARRRSSLRPSLREFSVSQSLSSRSEFSFAIEGDSSSAFIPSIFLLLATPYPDQQTLIHTHDYRTYKFRVSNNTFDAKPLHLINIGPAFRGHYSSFCPNSDFPYLPYQVRGSPMKEDRKESDGLSHMKQLSKDQNQLNFYAEGHEIGNLSKLLGSEASNYTSGLEDLYGNMLAKLDNLARLVESSSSKVLEQENCNMRLRYKVAGLE